MAPAPQFSSPHAPLYEPARHDLSIIIPAYNEAARLQLTLEELRRFLLADGRSAEVLLVNDGSTDGTAALARNFSIPGVPLRVLENPGNRGKGYSVRHGMLEARGGLLLFTDADLSAPIDELHKLEAAISAGADVAIGSRKQRELIRRHQSRFREWAGKCFNRFVVLTLRLPISDTQCGFKLFRRPAAQAIFPAQRIEHWGFDPELLFLARRFGFTVAEIPVVWAHAEGAKLRLGMDSASAFLEVLQIRWNALRRRYRRAEADARRRAASVCDPDCVFPPQPPPTN